MSTMRSRQEHYFPELSEPISHYTHAVSFGDLLFISGLVGVKDGEAQTDAAEQTRRIFEALTQILNNVGCTFEDVLKVTVFLTDIHDRAQIDPVRIEYFGEHRPASTLIQIGRLARPEARVEIEAVVGVGTP